MLSAFNAKQQMAEQSFKSLANFKKDQKNRDYDQVEPVHTQHGNTKLRVAGFLRMLPGDVVSWSLLAELASPTRSSSLSARGCVEVRRRSKASQRIMGRFLFPFLPVVHKLGRSYQR